MTTRIRLAIVAGGAVGTLVRWSLAGLPPIGHFPTGTLAANVLGAFALGVLVTVLGERAGEPAFTPLTGGLLGATTTFATFVAEIVELVDDQPVMAVTLGVASLALGVAAVAGGRHVARGAHT